ncbi:MAG: hypothetical protein JWN14_3514 [Chthonomonadales bacterium]|nr:hypothetical protein [Chthonomonadales bacterium]
MPFDMLGKRRLFENGNCFQYTDSGEIVRYQNADLHFLQNRCILHLDISKICLRYIESGPNRTVVTHAILYRKADMASIKLRSE